VAGRDHIDLRGATLAERPPTAAELARQRDDMGRALVRDLGALDQAVLLVDTFDHANEETCLWLERWLFEPLRRDLPKVLVVVAGRPEYQCRKFFDPRSLWSSLVHSVHHLSPFSDEHIRSHFQQRGIVIPAGWQGILEMARLGPAQMAQVGDLLAQALGGFR